MFSDEYKKKSLDDVEEYKRKVEEITVEIKENEVNSAELKKLHDLLEEYEASGKELTKCVSNSRNFSNLFPYSSSIREQSEKNTFCPKKLPCSSRVKEESDERISALKDKVDALLKTDEEMVAAKDRRERGGNIYWKIHNALRPSEYELKRGLKRLRKRSHARAVIGRFLRASLNELKCIAAANTVKRCVKVYLRNRKETKSALRIQREWRRRQTLKMNNKRAMAALLVTRNIKRRLLVMSAKKKVKNLIKLNSYVTKIQAIMRGIRGRKRFQRMRQDTLEYGAALRIQNLYWSK